MASQVTLNSTDFRMGLFETVSVLSNFLITDASLWTIDNVSPTAMCLLACVQDSNCGSVFYNDLTDVCIGHSEVYTASDTATASHGSMYFMKKKPAVCCNRGAYLCTKHHHSHTHSYEAAERGLHFLDLTFTRTFERIQQDRGFVVDVFYTYHSDRMSWDDARVECQKDNGDLAAFDTPDQFSDFKDYLDLYKKTSSVSNSIWVGLRQNTEDFLFYWTRDNLIGSTVTWSSGYPKNESKECGYISPFMEYVMMNSLCSVSLSFMCETPRV